MLRAQAATRVAAAAATSSSRAPLHTTTVLNAESARKRQARLTRQKNLAKRSELQQKAAAARPHVVLGTVAARNAITNADSSLNTNADAEVDAKWAACDLAKVLVRPEELAPGAPARRVFAMPDVDAAAVDEVRVPPALAFGMREREERMVFEHLPLLAADMDTRQKMRMSTGGAPGTGGEAHRKSVEAMSAHHESQLAAGMAQANVLARMVDLRNANAAGIAFENRRRVVEAFSEPGKPNDTGRTEVQAALLTLQVRNVWNHLREFKRDVASRRSLRRLVHQRAKLLKYLKRTDRDRYERVLERLGLEPGAVEGELVI